MADKIDFSCIEKICEYAIKDFSPKLHPTYADTGIACRGYFGPKNDCFRVNPCVATKFYWSEKSLEVNTDLLKMCICPNRKPKETKTNE
jgi:hypothetical protein